MDLLDLQIDLINTLSMKWKLLEAKEMHDKVHAVIVKTFPTQYSLQRRSLTALLNILGRMQKYSEQESIARLLVQMNLAHLGPKHEDTINAILNLASATRMRSQYNESEKLQHIAVELFHEIDSEDHSIICWFFIELGRLCQAMAYFEEALEYIRVGEKRAREFLGDEHRTTMGCNSHLGRALRQNGFIAESEELLFATAKLQIKVLGEDDF